MKKYIKPEISTIQIGYENILAGSPDYNNNMGDGKQLIKKRGGLFDVDEDYNEELKNTNSEADYSVSELW